MTLATPPREPHARAFEPPSERKPPRAPAAAPSLVWRKPSPSAPEGAAHPLDRDRESPTTSARANASASQADKVPTVAIMAQQAHEAVRANLLDSAVADRLADDVIRRVEKRLRIERERRGL